ncbi:MAG: flotillin family protein [Bacteroidales bacterium]|nr:flotillin family protein [Bacteroidales bacterium]
MPQITLILILVAVVFVTLAAILRRYRRCPSDKILVIYGKTGRKSSAKCIHGGAAFIWPVFQDYAYLDLKPISIECNLTNALSKQNIRVDVPCRFTVGISTEPEVMTNAAERLLGLSTDSIQSIATDILFGQLRLVIATMDIEEINADRDKFLASVSANVEAELRKIGLKLINVNVTDIRDESGYIEALGKEAAAKAINDAKKSVAEQNRYGETGKAMADKDTRVNVAAADADAVKGENSAKIEIANSDALRRQKTAEAERQAVAAEKVQAAKALQEAYQSERDAELARAEREQATQKAVLMMIADKLPELVKTQVEAVKGINIDKVTVWDTGSGENGKTATSNFISGMMKSVPPLDDLFKMAGMELPSYLKGKAAPEEQQPADEKK